MAASGSSYREVHMQILHTYRDIRYSLVGFRIPSLNLFWDTHFEHISAYTPKSTSWVGVSKVNWEKFEKDEDTQHPKA